MSQNREHFRVKSSEVVDVQIIIKEKSKDVDKTEKIEKTEKTEKTESEASDKLSQKIKMELIDISSGGLSAKCETSIEDGAELIIELPLGKEKFKVKGIVISRETEKYTRTMFIYRIQFKILSIKLEHKISSYINKIQTEIMNLKDIQAYDNGDTMSITDKILKEHGDRRLKIDFLKKWPNIASLVGWGIIIYTILLIFSSRPLAKDFLSQLFGAKTQLTWNHSLLYRAYISSIFLFVFSISSIIIDNLRQNRKNDFRLKALIIQFIISLTSILFFIQSLGIGQRGITK